MKPKAQTLQQKMGFFDEDLVKPKHDELMIWLDSNIENIVNDLFNLPFDEAYLLKTKSECEQRLNEMIEGFSSQINDYQNAIEGKSKTNYCFNGGPINNLHDLQNAIRELQTKVDYIRNLRLFDVSLERPRIKTIVKTWELPVMSQNSSYSNKYTVGFIDFAATFNIPTLILDGLVYDTSQVDGLKYLNDIKEPVKLNFIAAKKSIYVEVKTEIKSIGELIRQINHYRTYLKGDYYVLCPNDECRKILEDQNIGFINYKISHS